MPFDTPFARSNANAEGKILLNMHEAKGNASAIMSIKGLVPVTIPSGSHTIITKPPIALIATNMDKVS